MKNKKIITDCDGVLLDWSYAFDIWMREHGYRKVVGNHVYDQSIRYGISQDESYFMIKKFNESGCVGFIPAYKDSVEYVTKLNNLGWRFDVISCLDKDRYSQKLREENLIYIFGDVFDHIECGLDVLTGKSDYLSKLYAGENYFWIEDSISHAISGEEIGLRSVVMSHGYNKGWHGTSINNWKELYGVITNDSTY
jgi:FMN phosphatase YigB (HAD superfamily)